MNHRIVVDIYPLFPAGSGPRWPPVAGAAVLAGKLIRWRIPGCPLRSIARWIRLIRWISRSCRCCCCHWDRR